jgi:pimeloyl-ACP methyl ester carboxylesterase
MPTVSANGIELYYEARGHGPRLLFLNGSGATLATAALLIEPFTQRFETVAHDQRGLGQTSIPDGPYEMAQYAADALELLDHLGWDRCRVVGVSFGGMVAQELTVTQPERVERLALVCTSPGGGGGASYPLDELVDLAPDQRSTTMARLLDTRFTPEWLASHPGDRQLVALLGAREQLTKTEEQRRGEVEQLAARRHHDVWDRLSAVRCPTLVAGGRYDGIAPLPNAAAIASRIPDATLSVYEGGHAFFAQDPTALPDVVEFLAGPEPATA